MCECVYIYVCVCVSPTQVGDTGRHTLAAYVVSQTFVVVLFRHQVLQTLKRRLVLTTQHLEEQPDITTLLLGVKVKGLEVKGIG